MSKNNPEPPANVQLTPVGFSPKSSADAIGSVGGRLPLNEMQFPLSIPVAIILLTLIYSTVTDIGGFNRRIGEIDRVDAPALEKLKKVPKQTEFIESIRTSLVKLSATDPDAADILQEFYSVPGKTDSQPAPGTPSSK